eukprot:6208615-Pleurochrysis_carterae.AAC.1
MSASAYVGHAPVRRLFEASRLALLLETRIQICVASLLAKAGMIVAGQERRCRRDHLVNACIRIRQRACNHSSICASVRTSRTKLHSVLRACVRACVRGRVCRGAPEVLLVRKDLRLPGEVGASRVDQIKARQTILSRDLLEEWVTKPECWIECWVMATWGKEEDEDEREGKEGRSRRRWHKLNARAWTC